MGFGSQLRFRLQLPANVHPEGCQVLARVLGSLQTMQETPMELQAPGFALFQPQASGTVKQQISLPLGLSNNMEIIERKWVSYLDYIHLGQSSLSVLAH